MSFRRTVFSGTSGSGTTFGDAMTDFFSSTIVLSFPPSESKLLGGKCLTYIGTEGLYWHRGLTCASKMFEGSIDHTMLSMLCMEQPRCHNCAHKETREASGPAQMRERKSIQAVASGTNPLQATLRIPLGSR